LFADPTPHRSVRGTQPKSATARQPTSAPRRERRVCRSRIAVLASWSSSSFVSSCGCPSRLAVRPQCDLLYEECQLHRPSLGARAVHPRHSSAGVRPHRPWRPPPFCRLHAHDRGAHRSARSRRRRIGLSLARWREPAPSAFDFVRARDLRLQDPPRPATSADRPRNLSFSLGRSTTGFPLPRCRASRTNPKPGDIVVWAAARTSASTRQRAGDQHPGEAACHSLVSPSLSFTAYLHTGMSHESSSREDGHDHDYGALSRRRVTTRREPPDRPHHLASALYPALGVGR